MDHRTSCPCSHALRDHTEQGCLGAPSCPCRRPLGWVRWIERVERKLSQAHAPLRGTASDEVVARFQLPNIDAYVDCVAPMTGNVYATRGAVTVAVLGSGIDLHDAASAARVAEF